MHLVKPTLTLLKHRICILAQELNSPSCRVNRHRKSAGGLQALTSKIEIPNVSQLGRIVTGVVPFGAIVIYEPL